MLDESTTYEYTEFATRSTILKVYSSTSHSVHLERDCAVEWYIYLTFFILVLTMSWFAYKSFSKSKLINTLRQDSSLPDNDVNGPTEYIPIPDIGVCECGRIRA